MRQFDSLLNYFFQRLRKEQLIVFCIAGFYEPGIVNNFCLCSSNKIQFCWMVQSSSSRPVTVKILEFIVLKKQFQPLGEKEKKNHK